MDYSRIDTLVREHHTARKLEGKLASLEAQREAIGHTPKGIARAIRMTKAAINRAEILETHGERTIQKPEMYKGIKHYGKEEVRYREEGSTRQGSLMYVILTTRESGRIQYRVLTTSPTKRTDYPDNVQFDTMWDARAAAQKAADEYGLNRMRAASYSHTSSQWDSEWDD
jgi:hypothetical protein